MTNTGAVTITRSVASGAGRIVFGTFALSSSYASGGDTIAGGPDALGVGVLDHLDLDSQNSGHIVKWNGSATAPKAMVYGQLPSTDTAGVLVLNQFTGGNLTTITVNFMAFGH